MGIWSRRREIWAISDVLPARAGLHIRLRDSPCDVLEGCKLGTGISDRQTCVGPLEIAAFLKKRTFEGHAPLWRFWSNQLTLSVISNMLHEVWWFHIGSRDGSCHPLEGWKVGLETRRCIDPTSCRQITKFGKNIAR